MTTAKPATEATDDDVAELVERVEEAYRRASPGEWTRREPPPGYASVAFVQAPRASQDHAYDIEVLAEDTTIYPTRDGDVDFIVAIKNAWPLIRAALTAGKAVPSLDRETIARTIYEASPYREGGKNLTGQQAQTYPGVVGQYRDLADRIAAALVAGKAVPGEEEIARALRAASVHQDGEYGMNITTAHHYARAVRALLSQRPGQEGK